jgi:hypothetical protein
MAIAVLPLAACSSGDHHTMESITSAIEPMGFRCSVKERHPKAARQVGECRAQDHKSVKIIIGDWRDPEARQTMYQQRLPGMCAKLGLKGISNNSKPPLAFMAFRYQGGFATMGWLPI